MPSPPRINILGVGVSAMDKSMACDIIQGWIDRRESHYVCVTGVHGVMESQRDERLKEIHNAAGLVTADGMPLVWLGRLRGYRAVHRVYGPDLMLALCQCSVTSGYRHYLYGGKEGVSDRLAQRLQDKFPGLQIAGTGTPPFRAPSDQADEQAVAAINKAGPDIVWVGLSTPKQERWMAAHVGRLTAPVLIGVGAAFDFHVGLKKQAPRWVQRSGLEWLFRLLTEPRRLWRRYLVNNPAFLFLVTLQLLGLRKYPLNG